MTSNVRTTAPQNSHPVMPVAIPTIVVPTAPITVTALAVRPIFAIPFAMGLMMRLNHGRSFSSILYSRCQSVDV